MKSYVAVALLLLVYLDAAGPEAAAWGEAILPKDLPVQGWTVVT